MNKIPRLLSSFILRPALRLLNLAFFVYGAAFLARFLFEFLEPEQIRTMGSAALVWWISSPIIGPLQNGLSLLFPLPADIQRLIPLALSTTLWIVRQPLLTRLTSACSRLEGRSLDTLFAPPAARGKAAGWSAPPPPSGGDYHTSLPPVQEPAAESLAEHGARLIGRYELLEELGRRDVVVVYKATDRHLGRTVALKVIAGDNLSPEQAQPLREAFHREARAAARILHPGVVAVLDIAEDSRGNPYLVMEYVAGDSLQNALDPGAGKSLSLAERLAIAVEIAETLDYAHRSGVVHRDIKPSNILITADGHAKLLDFGIATLLDSDTPDDERLPGTPGFVAPELMAGSPASVRSDIFSFGVVLYWVFTGQMPFTGDSVTEITSQVLDAAPARPAQLNWALPDALDRVILRCLAKNPAARYASAEEVVSDLVVLCENWLQLSQQQENEPEAPPHPPPETPTPPARFSTPNSPFPPPALLAPSQYSVPPSGLTPRRPSHYTDKTKIFRLGR